MTITAPLLPTTTPTQAPRSGRDDLRAVPLVLRSEWIKLSTIRTSKVMFALTVVISAFAAWAVATLVTDEVLTVAEVFIYPVTLTAALSAIAGILLFTTEVQHGTLAAALAAQPARWVVVVCKVVTAAAVGLALGAIGLVAGVGGAVLGGLEMGDAAGMPVTVLWALLYTALAAVLGLGVGMIARHSTGAIAGLLVWWFVMENLLVTFAPAKVTRFLPFDAGYGLLDMESDFDTPEIIAAALTRAQCALVLGTYAAVAVLVGAVLLQRRDAT
jgi:ABC-2 type transport system permease protein